MFGTYLKKKFGKEKEIPANEKFYSPLRIALHSTIDIKTVDWIIIKEQLNNSMTLPSSSLTVLAIGETKTNDDTIYTFYTMDQSEEEFILQLYCTTSKGVTTIVESTLYKQVVNIVPLTESEWSNNLADLGWETLELDGNKYDRVWGEKQRGKLDFYEFNETIVEDDKTTNYTNNYMLYNRTFKSLIDTDETEMLLVGVEESSDTAEITMMLGLSVPLQNINIQ